MLADAQLGIGDIHIRRHDQGVGGRHVLEHPAGQVEHRGRYLVGIVRRVCPWVFEIQSKKQALRASQQQMHGQMSSKQAQSEPVQEPDFDLGLEQVRRIRELLGRRVA